MASVCNSHELGGVRFQPLKFRFQKGVFGMSLMRKGIERKANLPCIVSLVFVFLLGLVSLSFADEYVTIGKGIPGSYLGVVPFEKGGVDLNVFHTHSGSQLTDTTTEDTNTELSRHTAGRIHIVTAAAWAPNALQGTVVGQVRIFFQDGTYDTLNLILGHNIAEWAFKRKENHPCMFHSGYNVPIAYSRWTMVDSQFPYLAHAFYASRAIRLKPLSHLELVLNPASYTGQPTCPVMESPGDWFGISISAITLQIPCQDPPIFNEPADGEQFTAEEGVPFSFTVRAEAPCGQLDSITTSSLPEGAVLEPGMDTRKFSWTPNFDQGGQTYTVEFTAWAEVGLVSSQDKSISVEINVKDVPNNPPKIRFTQGGPSFCVQQGEPVNFSILAEDTENDIVELRNEPFPYGTASYTPGQGQASGDFSWDTTAAPIGDYKVVIITTDEHGASDSVSVSIGVRPSGLEILEPQYPEITAYLTLFSGDLFVVKVKAAGPDCATPVDLRAEGVPAGAGFRTSSSAGMATGTFYWPFPGPEGDYPVTFIAESTIAQPASRTVIIHVAKAGDELLNDFDGDGIKNEVDPNPWQVSVNYDDTSLGGTTFGYIWSSGDQTLTIEEFPNPDGVLIKSDPAGGAKEAIISKCGGFADLKIPAGVEAVVTCASVITQVLTGILNATYYSAEGVPAFATLRAQNSLTFDPLSFSFSAPATNVEDVMVFAGGKEFFIHPGQTVTIVLDLAIDIKPGSCPNPLNTKSKGVLPVAILGTNEFDVTEIDPRRVQLEGVPPLRWSVEDVATPFDGDRCHCHECGADGFDDLTLKFDNQNLLAALGDVHDGDEIVLTLRGSLLDGTPIEGQDCVLILKKGK